MKIEIELDNLTVEEQETVKRLATKKKKPYFVPKEQERYFFCHSGGTGGLMMTNEEAIELLHPNTTKEAIREIEENGGNGIKAVEEACVIACEALEKQIPKEPTHEATKFECFTCPTCKNVVDEFTDFIGQKVRVESPYCKLCGQKLKWGEEDDGEGED